jgi:hypothetical protein
MKLTINIDCTPAEARAFFGQPDMEPMNDMIVSEMMKRARDNMDTLADPERFMAQWVSMSGKGMEQFQNLMGQSLAGMGAKKK